MQERRDTTAISNVLGLQEVRGGSIFPYQKNRLAGNVTGSAPMALLVVK